MLIWIAGTPGTGCLQLTLINHALQSEVVTVVNPSLLLFQNPLSMPNFECGVGTVITSVTRAVTTHLLYYNRENGHDFAITRPSSVPQGVNGHLVSGTPLNWGERAV